MDEEQYPQVGSFGLADEEPLPVVGAGGVQEPEEDEREKISVEEASRNRRRNILHAVCGAYLIYLAIKLGSSFPEQLAKNGWQGDTLVCLIGCIAFSLISAALLIGVVIRLKRAYDKTKERR